MVKGVQHKDKNLLESTKSVRLFQGEAGRRVMLRHLRLNTQMQTPKTQPSAQATNFSRNHRCLIHGCGNLHRKYY